VIRCARCDWQPDPTEAVVGSARDQLAQHAAAAGHPLCIIDGRSLQPDETQTCTRCLHRAREQLSGIRTMFDELPAHLRTVGNGWSSGGPRGGSDGRPLPGGDVLALLGRGSAGLSEDSETTRDDDPTSVAFELGWWEAEWRELRGDAAHLGSPRSASREVRDAVAYLARHDGWAARNHPGFDEYAADLRRLHGRLERATGRAGRRQVAEAECFDCGGDLVRQLKNGTRCGHVLPPFPPEAVVPLGIRFTIDERRRLHAWQLERWERAHGRCEQGGFEDQWTCSRCGALYDWTRYLQALRAHLQAHPAQGWSLPEHVGVTLGVNPKTVRTWARRGLVAAACLVGDRRLRVWFPQVAEEHERRLEAERRRVERREQQSA
jgi:hypothetical protein